MIVGNSKSATQCWRQVLIDVLKHGAPRSPRGQETIELLNYRSLIDMRRPVVISKARKLSYRFMFTEARWILEGRNDLKTLVKFAPSMKNYSDDGLTLFGAYGPWILAQLPYVVNALIKDQSTRQAVLTIWRQNPPVTRDCPCTVSVQWLIRDDHLHCIDNMRSSDVWLGWPYDVFSFSMVSLVVALFLKTRGVQVELGGLFLNAGSQHIYERNMSGALDALAEEEESGDGLTFSVQQFENVRALMDALRLKDE